MRNKTGGSGGPGRLSDNAITVFESCAEEFQIFYFYYRVIVLSEPGFQRAILGGIPADFPENPALFLGCSSSLQAAPLQPNIGRSKSPFVRAPNSFGSEKSSGPQLPGLSGDLGRPFPRPLGLFCQNKKAWQNAGPLPPSCCQPWLLLRGEDHLDSLRRFRLLRGFGL